MRNRAYSPQMGRFMQPDPYATAMMLIEAASYHGRGLDAMVAAFDVQGMYGDGMNLYAYLGANPWMRSDPLGLSWDPFDMVDEYLAESAGNSAAFMSALGQGMKATAILAATIASYLPFPFVGNLGEVALYALGETTDEGLVAAMALGLIPGGKLGAKFGSFLGRIGSSAWSSAKNYASKHSGALSRGAGGLMSRATEFLRRKPASACGFFVAGTLVWTLNGLLPIEEVTSNDVVIARDETAGVLSLQRVGFQMTVRETAILDLGFRRHDTSMVSLSTTDEHPFWVEGSGWVRADNLQPGDRVRGIDGWLTTATAAFSNRRTTVYNLAVNGRSNFFVGPDGIWVHNCGFDQLFKVKYEHFVGRHGWDRILGMPNPSNSAVAEVLEKIVAENGAQISKVGDSLNKITVYGTHNGHQIYAQIVGLKNGLYEITSAGIR